jgi:hypothetical protein
MPKPFIIDKINQLNNFIFNLPGRCGIRLCLFFDNVYSTYVFLYKYLMCLVYHF